MNKVIKTISKSFFSNKLSIFKTENERDLYTSEMEYYCCVFLTYIVAAIVFVILSIFICPGKMDYTFLMYVPLFLIMTVLCVAINRKGLSQVNDKISDEEYILIKKSTLNKLRIITALSAVYSVVIGIIVLFL